MKRITLWGFGLVLAGVALWWGFQGAALATHNNPSTGYNHNHYIGLPGDGVSDGDGAGASSERSGFDRHADRTPDGDSAGSANDRGGKDGDGTASGTPDCSNGAGDGDSLGGNGAPNFPCGNPTSAGDATPERPAKGAGDFVSDSVPDRRAAPGFNRFGDSINDERPERSAAIKDNVADRVGVRDCLDAPECDRGHHTSQDFTRDRIGRDGNVSSADYGAAGQGDGVNDRAAVDIIAGFDNPNRPGRDGNSNGSQGDATPSRVAAANQDSTPDASQDRNLAGDSRDSGQLNHAQKARDAFNTGPGDRNKDDFMGGGSDRGGFGYAGSSGGCSLVAAHTATTGSNLAYLLVLLAPVALVVIRRRLRK